MTQHIVTRAFAATAVAAIASLALALPASAMPPPDPGPETAGPPAVAYVPADSSYPIIPVGAGVLVGLGIGAAAVTARTARRHAHQPGVA